MLPARCGGIHAANLAKWNSVSVSSRNKEQMENCCHCASGSACLQVTGPSCWLQRFSWTCLSRNIVAYVWFVQLAQPEVVLESGIIVDYLHILADTARVQASRVVRPGPDRESLHRGDMQFERRQSGLACLCFRALK